MQGFFDILLRMKSVKIVTMTMLSSDAGKIPQLNIKDAEYLKNLVLERIVSLQTATDRFPGQKKAGTPIENTFPIMKARYALSLIASSLLFLILFYFFVLYSFPESTYLTIFLIIPLLLIVPGALIMPFTTKYWLGNENIEIQYGLLPRIRLTILYSRIQDIILEKGFIGRILGLWQVKVETGANEEYEYGGKSYKTLNSIPALLKDDAFMLKKLLIKSMGYGSEEGTTPLVHEIPLEGSKPLKKTISFIVPLLIIFVIAFIIAVIYFQSYLSSVFLPAIATFLITLLLKFVRELLYLRSYYYNFTTNMLIISKGVISIKEISLPFDKIQNVFVDQDIFDRIFGLFDVHVSTVSERSRMEAHIDGLSMENANRLKEILLGKIKQR